MTVSLLSAIVLTLFAVHALCANESTTRDMWFGAGMAAIGWVAWVVEMMS